MFFPTVPSCPTGGRWLEVAAPSQGLLIEGSSAPPQAPPRLWALLGLGCHHLVGHKSMLWLPVGSSPKPWLPFSTVLGISDVWNRVHQAALSLAQAFWSDDSFMDTWCKALKPSHLLTQFAPGKQRPDTSPSSFLQYHACPPTQTTP